MTSAELLRKLRGLGVAIERSRGKGGHVMLELHGRRSVMSTASGDMPNGTVRTILRQLGLRPEDLR